MHLRSNGSKLCCPMLKFTFYTCRSFFLYKEKFLNHFFLNFKTKFPVQKRNQNMQKLFVRYSYKINGASENL